MPNITYESLDEVPEDLRDFVHPLEGDENKLVVNVVPKKRLDEFRTNNTELLNERDHLKAANSRLAGIVGEDIEGFEKKLIDLKTVSQRVKDGDLTESTDVEEAIAKRVSGIVEGYDSQLKKTASEVAVWKETAAKKDAELRRNHIDNEITRAVLDSKSGARPEALHDIKTRAYNVFVVEDGKVIAKKGEATIYSSNGVDPMSPLEWISSPLKEEAGYLFKDSSGGGASGGDTTNSGGLTAAQLDKMTPLQKITHANKK